MSNFDQQVKASIETYAELSGMTFEEVAAEVQKLEGPIYRAVTMIMFAAH